MAEAKIKENATDADLRERQRRALMGFVVSDKMEKTIVVQVTRRFKHPKYKKYVNERVRYKAHDENNEAKVGDRVRIIESRPLSRDKDCPMAIQIGDAIPAATFNILRDGVQAITTDEVFGGRKLVLFAVPGAFTPTCSAKHLPGFVEKFEEFRGRGIDVACMAVNDAFVMDAWAKHQDVPDPRAGPGDGRHRLRHGPALQAFRAVRRGRRGEEARRRGAWRVQGIQRRVGVEDARLSPADGPGGGRDRARKRPPGTPRNEKGQRIALPFFVALPARPVAAAPVGDPGCRPRPLQPGAGPAARSAISWRAAPGRRERGHRLAATAVAAGAARACGR